MAFGEDMKKRIYPNKLVRDKIPSLILEQDHECQSFILGDDELVYALNKKMTEEMAELMEAHANPTVGQILEELADVYEVVLGLSEALGYDLSVLEERARKKRQLRGGFTCGIWLNWFDS